MTLVRGTYNFELFSTEQPDLDKAIPAMAEFHEQWGGRTEYRARARGGTFVAAIARTCIRGVPQRTTMLFRMPSQSAPWRVSTSGTSSPPRQPRS